MDRTEHARPLQVHSLSWRTLLGALWLVSAAACAPGGSRASTAAMTDSEYLRAARLMVPVHGVAPREVADTYAARRGERAHAALDIMAKRGTPVVAAVDAEVRRVSENALGGRTVYLVDRGGRFVLYYAHLDRYHRRTTVGQRVAPGDVIGYVGTTGNAPRDLPHLHFQLTRLVAGPRWWDGPPVNPHPYLARPGKAR
jgi:murein DD-endopeptidase MepM/ murein hydrolase activator NlpD